MVRHLRPDRGQLALRLKRAGRIERDRDEADDPVHQRTLDVDALHAFVGQVQRRLLEEALADEQAVFGDSEPEVRPLDDRDHRDQQECTCDEGKQDTHAEGLVVAQQQNGRDDRDSSLNGAATHDLHRGRHEGEDGEGRQTLPVAGNARVHWTESSVTSELFSEFSAGAGAASSSPGSASPSCSIRSEMYTRSRSAVSCPRPRTL